MKCPLFTTSSIDQGGIIDYKRWECLKEECPLWHPTTQSCDIDRIASNLSTIANALVGILEKMSHEGQFRK